MAKRILTKPFKTRDLRKRPRKIKSPQVLLKGTKRLMATRQRMLNQELKELKYLQKRAQISNKVISTVKKGRRPTEELQRLQALQARVVEKIRRIKSLEKKAGFLIRPRAKQVERFAMRDGDFPNLLNRIFFFEEVKKRLEKPGSHTVVYLDMDRLKQVNNKFGRSEGGMGLLTAYSKALSKTVGADSKKKKFSGHLGGDEFVIYLKMSEAAARTFMRQTFEPVLRRELKKWLKYKEALRTKKLKDATRRITMTYSAGLIEVKQGTDIRRVEQAASRLCDIAKRKGQESNTISSRKNFDLFVKEALERGIKI